MKILLTANRSWNLSNFRAPIIEALVNDGHELVAVAPDDESVVQLRALGVRCLPIKINNKGTAPLQDLKLIRDFRRVFRAELPDVILSYTIKNNIYGGIAARTLGIPFLPNVSGLGTAFLSSGWIEHVATFLYKRSFRPLPHVIFQNSDDQDLFVKRCIISPNQALLVPGSGIDLERFKPEPLPAKNEYEPTYLLIARLLRDKGIYEYIEAARQVRKQYPNARFQLLGETGAENRTAINIDTVEEWVREGIVDYLGVTDDVRPYIADADCVVLPSYREGTPRTLLEAAAMGRPLVSTDVPGCRAVIEDGQTGFLCHVKDPTSLALALIRMIEVGGAKRSELGANGRKKMEQEFSQEIVVEIYRTAIANISSCYARHLS